MTEPADGAGPGKQEGRGLSNLMQRLLTAVVLIPILVASMFADKPDDSAARIATALCQRALHVPQEASP